MSNDETVLLNGSQALNHALDVTMTNNDKVITFGQDAGKYGGLYKVTKGLQAKFGEARCFETILDEAAIMGAAIGLALNGMLPVVEIQYEGFMYGAMQQFLGHAARMRNRTRSVYTCPLVVRTPVGVAPNSFEHHSEALEALFCHIPGIKVIMPSNPYDMKGLLIAAINDPDPVIFLEPKRLYVETTQAIPKASYEVAIGVGKVIKTGNDLTVVSYGNCLVDSHKAILTLEKKYPQYTIELIDLRTLQPWDRELVINSVLKTKKLLVVHEAVTSFSFANEIITTVIDACWETLQTRPRKLCSPDIIIPYNQGLDWYYISPKIISNEILHILTK